MATAGGYYKRPRTSKTRGRPSTAPVFSLAVVAVMALGIAATTAAFGLVHSTLLAPLPYPDADRLVMVWEHNLTRNRPRNVINPGNFFAWSERSTSIESAGMFSPTVGNLAGEGGALEEVPGMVVQTSVLGLVGAQPSSACSYRATATRPRRAPSG